MTLELDKFFSACIILIMLMPTIKADDAPGFGYLYGLAYSDNVFLNQADKGDAYTYLAGKAEFQQSFGINQLSVSAIGYASKYHQYKNQQEASYHISANLTSRLKPDLVLESDLSTAKKTQHIAALEHQPGHERTEQIHKEVAFDLTKNTKHGQLSGNITCAALDFRDIVRDGLIINKDDQDRIDCKVGLSVPVKKWLKSLSPKVTAFHKKKYYKSSEDDNGNDRDSTETSLLFEMSHSTRKGTYISTGLEAFTRSYKDARLKDFSGLTGNLLINKALTKMNSFGLSLDRVFNELTLPDSPGFYSNTLMLYNHYDITSTYRLSGSVTLSAYDIVNQSDDITDKAFKISLSRPLAKHLGFELRLSHSRRTSDSIYFPSYSGGQIDFIIQHNIDSDTFNPLTWFY